MARKHHQSVPEHKAPEQPVVRDESEADAPTVVSDDAGGEGADVPPDAAEPAPYSPMGDLEGSSGALHAIHVRLAEMLPFLPAAIEEADGALKAFLEMLLGLLKA